MWYSANLLIEFGYQALTPLLSVFWLPFRAPPLPSPSIFVILAAPPSARDGVLKLLEQACKDWLLTFRNFASQASWNLPWWESTYTKDIDKCYKSGLKKNVSLSQFSSVRLTRLPIKHVIQTDISTPRIPLATMIPSEMGILPDQSQSEPIWYRST